MPKIHGFVNDLDGKPIRRAVVTFVGKTTGEEARAKTSATGEYTTDNLSTGDYEWTAETKDLPSAKGLFRLRGTAEVVENQPIIIGAGSISGRVTDKAGNPIPEAEVKATDAQSQDHGPVSTDTKGRYSISHLAPGKYLVNVQAPADFQVPTPLSAEVKAGEDTPDINFELAPKINVGSISGRVFDPAGAPVQGAAVRTTDAAGKVFGPVTTDVRGGYQIPDLPAGAYRVSVQPSVGFEDPPPINVDLQPGQNLTNRDFRLTASIKPGSITGRVTSQSGAAVQGAKVAATNLPTQVVLATTDAAGDYSIANLIPGAYVVSVEAPSGFQNPAPLTVNVAPSQNTGNINFQLAPVILTGSVSGHVTSQAGAAVQGASITANNQQNQVAGQATADANGDYSIANLPAGAYTITVQAPSGFQNPTPLTVNIAPSQNTGNINFQLAPVILTGSVSGRVTSQAGAAVQGASITANNQQNQVAGQASTDANGDYSIASLPAGAYTITVQAPAGFQTPTSLSVSVAGGQSTANTNFQLSAVARGGGSISGRVMDGSGKGIPVRTVTASGSGGAVVGQGVTDAAGDYSITNLPAGNYTVEVVEVQGQPSFVAAYNVEVVPAAATTGIDFSEDVVADFLGRLDDTRFSIESLINEDEANQAVNLFSVVNLMLAGLGRRAVGTREKADILGVLTLYYGLQEGSLRRTIVVTNPTALWSSIEGELKTLASTLDQLQTDVAFLNREGRRQFNLGLSNGVLANVTFPPLFNRYVVIGTDPLLAFDIKAADQDQFFDKTRIAEADELLRQLKRVTVEIVRSLSKWGTAATKRVNEDWSEFETRALEVLSIVARDRVSPDQDDHNVWSVLADLTGKNREIDLAPYVVLARHGGKLLTIALQVFKETQRELERLDPTHLRDLFQRGNIQRDFLTERIRAEATVVKRYPLTGWE